MRAGRRTADIYVQSLNLKESHYYTIAYKHPLMETGYEKTYLSSIKSRGMEAIETHHVERTGVYSIKHIETDFVGKNHSLYAIKEK